MKFDPILLARIRSVLLSTLAQDLCGVQPMTGPTNLVYTMRARYGHGYPCCIGDCVAANIGAFYEWIVDIPRDRKLDVNEVTIWAIQYLRAGYNHAYYEVASTYTPGIDTPERAIHAWRWSFEDPNEAFHFKLRWY